MQASTNVANAANPNHLEYRVILKKAKGFCLRFEVESGFEPL